MIEDLLHWANRQGTTLHPSVEIYEDPTTGFSFRAVENISIETKLVSCPYGVSLSYLNALDVFPFARHSSEAFPQIFLDTLEPEHPNIIGHFFLMQQYLLGEKSFWWTYMRLLPQPDKPSNIPALWSEEDQKYLNGTNVEPAIRNRISLWEDDWLKAISLLSGFPNAEKYTSSLYRWAASVFGSRSFRPSLTIPISFVPDNATHIAEDKFSVLFPVMDIGNHNGTNNVDWTTDTFLGAFVLSNRSTFQQNEQIYNYYGNKSNGELLVAYGFILPPTPHLDRDVVNLELKPQHHALATRRTQCCYMILADAGEEVSDFDV